MRRSLATFPASGAVILAALLASPAAFAQAAPATVEIAPGPIPAPAVEADVLPVATSILPEAPLEAPPPPPRRTGLVLESQLGALAFLGDFKHIAPTAPWWHADVGYEIFRWLAVFGYGELAFTSTSELQGSANSIAFPMYGFGGGLRGTVHVSDRVALFLEGDGGVLRADVPKGALVDLGYANAEKFGPSFGGRVGVEWYQIDRHLAFGLDVGVRDATGFAEQFVGTGPPLMLDASAAIRYSR